jgi:hypothetical protein
MRTFNSFLYSIIHLYLTLLHFDMALELDKSSGLCARCDAFFKEEAKLRGHFSRHVSPSDWQAHCKELYPDGNSLLHLADSDCSLCLMVWHGLGLEALGDPNTIGGVLLRTNPRGRSPSVRGQTTHLIVEALPSKANGMYAFYFPMYDSQRVTTLWRVAHSTRVLSSDSSITFDQHLD